MKEDSEEAVADMIYYFYHGTYDLGTSQEVVTTDLEFHLQVHIIGDKYAVRGLSNLGKKRFCALLEASWDTDAFAGAIRAI